MKNMDLASKRRKEDGPEMKPEIKEDEKKKKMKVGGIKTMPFILGTNPSETWKIRSRSSSSSPNPSQAASTRTSYTEESRSESDFIVESFSTKSANEMCDKFAVTGFHANMITYLTQKLNMPMVQASNTLSNFSGTSSLTPLIGALIADSFAGRFWTILIASIIYEFGLVSVTISAILPSLQPPPCPTELNCQEASSFQIWFLYLSLLLTAIGTGGIRPCVVTFAADQIDMRKSSVEGRKWNFFNWYYFTMGFATLIALTIVVYIQDNVGWGWGLGIPTIAMALSIVAFGVGSHLYRKLKPGGSPLVRLAQVVVAAAKKRKAKLPEDSELLYQNSEMDALISVHGRLLHTDQFKWLDKAAIVTHREAEESSPSPNLWRLATVHRVEELKAIIRMLPIWAAGILLVTSASHLSSFTIIQARTMERHLSPSFKIPPASLSIFSNITMLLGLVFYERLFVRFARRFTKNPAGITCLQRMGVGFVINIFATLVSSVVEIKRKSVAARHGLLDHPAVVIPISVFWLVPQYCIHGLAEVFMNVGHLEFLYDQSPESMRSTAAALYWIAISIGSYGGTLLVTLVHKYTSETGNWLPDRNLNRGRLEYYYWLVSGIQVVNLVYYLVCAWLYTYKPLQEASENGEEEKEEDREKVPYNYGEVELSRKGDA